MPTPTGGYRNAAGKRIPGTTTITGLYGDKNGMIYVANRLALEPLLEARTLLVGAAQINGHDPQREGWLEAVNGFLARDPGDWDHKILWGKQADAGTAAHEMFECHCRGVPFEPGDRFTPEVLEIAKPAFQAAVAWAEQSKYKVVEAEVALVSEKYQFGGTRDGVFIGEKRSIADVKTSKAIYPEYLLQLAAYGILDEEAGNTIEGYHILHFTKQEKPGDPVHWSHHYWSHLDAAREAFILCRKLYSLMADIGKLAK